MQPQQGPVDGLEAYIAAQAAAPDKGKGKGKPPPWLANPWTSQAWGVPWTDTWGGPWPPVTGKGMRYRDRTDDGRPPKKAYADRPPRDPRPCAACGAPYECKFRTGTGHGFCTNNLCVRSQANKEARHGGARKRTPSRKKDAAGSAAAAPPTTAAAAPGITAAAATAAPATPVVTCDLISDEDLIPLGDGRAFPKGAHTAEPQQTPQQQHSPVPQQQQLSPQPQQQHAQPGQQGQQQHTQSQQQQSPQQHQHAPLVKQPPAVPWDPRARHTPQQQFDVLTDQQKLEALRRLRLRPLRLRHAPHAPPASGGPPAFAVL